MAKEAHAEAEQFRGAQRIAVLLLVAGAVDARIDVRLDAVKTADSFLNVSRRVAATSGLRAPTQPRAASNAGSNEGRRHSLLRSTDAESACHGPPALSRSRTCLRS